MTQQAPRPGAGRAASAPLVGNASEPTLFEFSSPGRRAYSLRTTGVPGLSAKELIPAEYLRDDALELAEVSERDLVGHFTRLAHRQYCVDLGAYPLGSCTMKYNPKICDEAASLRSFAGVHPSTPVRAAQGWMQILVELEEMLCSITGMAAATLQPAAGAAGELTGLLLMRAFHEARGDHRSKVIIPDSAHGTNPASVTLGGYEVVTVGSDGRGFVNVAQLKDALGPDIAGIMLTNPNTLGLFEEDIVEIARLVHEVGGLLYYDGANLNPILGVVRPGDMGFDIVHMNLHKTFATPHGGGGPGAGPVAVSQRLVGYLPGPRPVRSAAASDEFILEQPAHSIGRVHTYYGNSLVLLRAWTYIRLNGAEGLRRVADVAVLNANWLREKLRGFYDFPYDHPVMHECVISVSSLKKTTGVRALDVAKRLLEFGFHAPTVYFPLIVDEALMIEPTETESPETIAALAAALVEIAQEAAREREEGTALTAAHAPRSTPVQRVDEARAARQLVSTFDARR